MTLVEFSYNNSYHSSIPMAPFEALYGRRCRSQIGWFEVGVSSLLDPEYIYTIFEKVHIMRNYLKKTYSRQKFYAIHRRRDLEFQ